MARQPETDTSPSLLHDVPSMRDGDLELRLARRSPAGSNGAWTPAYHFEMRLPDDAVAGWIDLRVGDAPELTLYNGHIGYTVREKYRGRHYAARSTRLLAGLARHHGFTELWITCNPENIASRRTCELAGAEYVETVELPTDIDLYRRGERSKCRYRLLL